MIIHLSSGSSNTVSVPCDLIPIKDVAHRFNFGSLLQRSDIVIEKAIEKHNLTIYVVGSFRFVSKEEVDRNEKLILASDFEREIYHKLCDITMSRQDLVAWSGKSNGCITRALNSLIEHNLVIECGYTKSVRGLRIKIFKAVKK